LNLGEVAAERLNGDQLPKVILEVRVAEGSGIQGQADPITSVFSI
jgi:hypothetical protein